MPDLTHEKKAAAHAALHYIESGMVVGLGSGSTSSEFIKLLGERVQADALQIRGIPTSAHSHKLATSLGIPLITFQEVSQIDVSVDGADEIDPHLRLIKGHGGALLREKIVATATRRFVVIADHSKLVKVLGAMALPVEVIEFAEPLLIRRISALGANVALRIEPDGEPFITDSGNHILNCEFGEIRDPEKLGAELDHIPGVVEHGLFVALATVALVAHNEEVTEHHHR
jgi:ribose 5-phosphate isomerase A